MAKQKAQNDIKNVLLDTLAEFYQNVIKKEMASKKDLERFATKKDLDEVEANLLEEIRGNNRLITNIEVSLLNKTKNHEARIKVLEKFHPQITA